MNARSRSSILSLDNLLLEPVRDPARVEAVLEACRLPPWYRFSTPASIVARDLIEVKERSTQEQHRREGRLAGRSI